jgi:NAD(P)-dependent dehydrogenase (short-subunit alcohol dehydrogenase family)
MDLQLQDKIALVTGSTAGIGFAIASLLAKEGATVVVNGRTAQRVEEAVGKIVKATPTAKVSGVDADVSSAEGVVKLVAALPQVDILVNNAGIFEPKPFAEIPDEDWFRFFEANVMSGVRLSRFYFPKMLKQNWGRIVFISSESSAQFEKEFFVSARPSSLLKRFSTTEEVANLVAYVCSPLASSTNGASLRVDGGVVRSIA